MYIHIIVKPRKTSPKETLVESSPLPCLCAATRQAGRILTKRYDHHLKPSGLKVTQFSLLANIARNPGLSVSELAELLWMDQTTVTRNLRVLERAGFIRLEPESTDHRIKRIQVTESGLSRMETARPLWEQAQQEMKRVLGGDGIRGLLGGFSRLSG